MVAQVVDGGEAESALVQCDGEASVLEALEDFFNDGEVLLLGG